MSNMNYEIQRYKNIPLKLINRNYKNYKAKRYTINATNQNIWIPNCYLQEDGTIKENSNLDFIFNNKQGKRKFELAKLNVNFGGN